MRKRLLVLIALSIAVALWWWPRGEETHASGVAREAPSSQEWPWWRRLLTGVRGTTDLTLTLIDPDGEPVPGLRVVVDGRERVTDERGHARFVELPWGTLAWSLPEGWASRDYPEGIQVFDPSQWIAVLVYRVCAGDVAVRLPDGSPAAGFDLSVGSFPRTGSQVALDPEGVVHLRDRPCGRVRVRVDGYPSQVVEVLGEERVEIELPGEGEATLRLVTAAGESVDGELVNVDAEGIGEGTFRVSAPGEVVVILATAEGFADLQVWLPLDGEIHVAVLEALRRVRVTVLGEEPEAIECGDQMAVSRVDTCARLAEDWDCSCPPRDAYLRTPIEGTPWSGMQAGIPDDVTEYTLDLREGTAVVEARWTGGTPCKGSIDVAASDLQSEWTCASDGTLTFRHVRPGDWTLGAWCGKGCSGSRPVHVPEGASYVDAGSFGPDEGALFGVILADFPLDDAWIYASRGEAEVMPDGGFVVSDIPMTGEVRVWLQVFGWGRFERTFVAGEIAVWELGWQSDQKGLSDDPSPEQDTGWVPEDSGDTG